MLGASGPPPFREGGRRIILGALDGPLAQSERDLANGRRASACEWTRRQALLDVEGEGSGEGRRCRDWHGKADVTFERPRARGAGGKFGAANSRGAGYRTACIKLCETERKAMEVCYEGSGWKE